MDIEESKMVQNPVVKVKVTGDKSWHGVELDS